jgi:hypothetical protein
MRVLPDMRVQQPRFVILHLGKAILELHSAILGGLHLRASQGKPRFKPFQQMVIMPSMTVVAQDLDTRLQVFNKGSGLDAKLRLDLQTPEVLFSSQRQESTSRQSFMWKFPTTSDV